MKNPNEHDARINNPENYVRFARRVNGGGTGVDYVYGFTEAGDEELHAVRFKKDKFTPAKAKSWLKSHNTIPIAFEPAINAGEISTDVSDDSRLKDFFPVAATGKFPQGDLTEGIFDEVVANFNPSDHEPPVTLGHVTREHNAAPAFAWIDSVKRVGNILYAKAKQVSKELDDLLKSGRFKKRSIGLRQRDDGSHYLHHLAFLGATAPAVKGLPDVYSDYLDESTAVNFEHEDTTFNFKRKETSMKEYTEQEIKALTDAAATNAAAKAKADAEKDFAEKAKKDADVAAEVARKDERAKVEKEFSDKSAATAKSIAHRAEVDKFVDESIKNGSLVPAQVSSARALLYAAETAIALTYSEGEGDTKKEVKTDSFAALKNLISNFGEVTEGETGDPEHGTDRGGDEKKYAEEKVKVKEIMKANPSMSYGQALKQARLEMSA